MQVLAVLMAVDYISGVFCAIKDKSLSSQIGFVGILRKLMMFGVVLAAAQVDRLLGQGAICRSAAIMFYAANEGISVLENTGRLGLPWPEKLMDVLAQLKGDKASVGSDAGKK
jgi:toxin secretion/phage lysis holin